MPTPKRAKPALSMVNSHNRACTASLILAMTHTVRSPIGASASSQRPGLRKIAHFLTHAREGGLAVRFWCGFDAPVSVALDVAERPSGQAVRALATIAGSPATDTHELRPGTPLAVAGVGLRPSSRTGEGREWRASVTEAHR